jgi:membrane-anchored protein YejM (alkaline phosphatase superfamily)
MIYNESPRRKQITQQVSWGHWFAFANILMAIAISSVYLFSTPIADTPISFIYLITTWLGHTAFITFLGFVILIMPLCYQLTNLRVLKGVASLIAAICLALLAFDALLYNKTGFHITLSSAELLRSETAGQISAFGWLQWFYLFLLTIIWLMFQLVVANAIFKRIARFQRLKFGPYLITSLVVCFITSHAIHIWADARLYTPVLKQDNMFPLSYPATAKTLMARYGLLDLNQRQQQEELQYNSQTSRFTYPPQQVYCSVNKAKKVVVLATLDEISTEIPGLGQNDFHLNMQTDNQGLARQLLYGIPNNLLQITAGPAVATELLSAFDVELITYVDGKLNTHDLSMADASFVQSSDQAEQPTREAAFKSFSERLLQSDSGFYMGVVSSEELNEFDLEGLNNDTNLILIHKLSAGQFILRSNFVNNDTISTNEDVIPTVLFEFGCLAEAMKYSTGQTLQNPNRQWLVSTYDNNLIVVKYPLKTIIATDGSYEVIDVNSNTKVLLDIDTNLLSRSIKHLEDFSAR